jgi:hypothetical protein
MFRTFAVIALLMAALTGCQRGEPMVADERAEEAAVSAFSMDQYQWRNRPLVVFSPAADDAALQRQRDIIEQHRAGFGDRDMVLVAIIGNDGGRAGEQALTADDARQLRQRYGVPADQFAVRLVGKDGGVKLESDEPVTAERLFGLIDAMPMRQREMGEDDGN